MNRYKVDYPEEVVIEIAVKEWVLEWAKKHNPEVFNRGRAYISRILEKNNEN
jgi:hypothetical protein